MIKEDLMTKIDIKQAQEYFYESIEIIENENIDEIVLTKNNFLVAKTLCLINLLKELEYQKADMIPLIYENLILSIKKYGKICINIENN